MKPAIAIQATHDSRGLELLLRSLSQVDIAQGTLLQIIIDGPQEESSRASWESVCLQADTYTWPYGNKRVVIHDHHVGPFSHYQSCGNLSAEWGAVVILNESLLVGQQFARYAGEALSYYESDDTVAGIGLHTITVNPLTRQPFLPLLDDNDVFFVSAVSGAGQAYSQTQWERFRQWMTTNDPETEQAQDIDTNRQLSRYLSHTGRSFAYSRQSLTTTSVCFSSDATGGTIPPPVALQNSHRPGRFRPRLSALSSYDSHYEIRPQHLIRVARMLDGYSFEVDLYATKAPEALTEAYVLTTRPCKESLFSFSRTMRPMEANVIYQIPGHEIHFARRDTVDFSSQATTMIRRANNNYFARLQASGRRNQLRLHLADRLQRARKSR